MKIQFSTSPKTSIQNNSSFIRKNVLPYSWKKCCILTAGLTGSSFALYQLAKSSFRISDNANLNNQTCSFADKPLSNSTFPQTSLSPDFFRSTQFDNTFIKNLKIREIANPFKVNLYLPAPTSINISQISTITPEILVTSPTKISLFIQNQNTENNESINDFDPREIAISNEQSYLSSFISLCTNISNIYSTYIAGIVTAYAAAENNISAIKAKRVALISSLSSGIVRLYARAEGAMPLLQRTRTSTQGAALRIYHRFSPPSPPVVPRPEDLCADAAPFRPTPPAPLARADSDSSLHEVDGAENPPDDDETVVLSANGPSEQESSLPEPLLEPLYVRLWKWMRG